MNEETQVNISSKWARRIKAPFWGLVVAIGPAAILFLGGAGTQDIIDNFRSSPHSLYAYGYAILGTLSLLCLAVSVGITMDVYRGVLAEEKRLKTEANNIPDGTRH